MKKNVIEKVLIILIMIFSIFSLVNTPKVYASNVLSSAENFIALGKGGYEGQIIKTIDQDSTKKMSDTLFNILLILAIIAAVIIGIVIGIQFVTGSVSEKAKVKETLIPYVAGCIIVFGAFTIWKLVVTIGNNIEGDNTLTPQQVGYYTLEEKGYSSKSLEELKKRKEEVVNELKKYETDSKSQEAKALQNELEALNREISKREGKSSSGTKSQGVSGSQIDNPK